MELRKFGDGTNNIVDQHNVERYGLRVLVSRNLDAVLAGWRSAADVAAAGLLVIFITLAFAVRRIEISDRRRAEAHVALQDQLTRASKLESLGALAGGVAHDFNNVLAGHRRLWRARPGCVDARKRPGTAHRSHAPGGAPRQGADRPDPYLQQGRGDASSRSSICSRWSRRC